MSAEPQLSAVEDILRAHDEYVLAVNAIADAIIERVPFAVMNRLIVHPYRWGVVVEATKHPVVAKLGATFLPDAWDEAKQEAWRRLAVHNDYRWPEGRR